MGGSGEGEEVRGGREGRSPNTLQTLSHPLRSLCPSHLGCSPPDGCQSRRLQGQCVWPPPLCTCCPP